MSIADKLTTIAENEQKVFEAGRQAEYDEFWETFQNKGAKTNYNDAFKGWYSACFKPKYFVVTSAQNMFQNASMIGNEYIKRLDFSQCVNFIQAFYSCSVEELGIIDASNTVKGYGFTSIFASATKLSKIEKFIFPKDSNVAYNTPFLNCNRLTDITIGGTIHKTISFSSSPLSKESIESIINALSSSASSQTLTLKQTAKETAFTDEEWATLIATKPNWTISLA